MNKDIIEITINTVLIISAIIACSVGIYWISSNIYQIFESKEKTEYLTNDQIITETKKCEEAGLKATTVYNGWTYEVRRVICKPNKQ